MPGPRRLAAGLVDACDNRSLFNLPLWPRQRELLAAVEAGPRTHVLAVGRRSGKSTMCALTGLWNCLLRPDLDAMVRPGEARYTVAVATTQNQARVLLDAAKSIVLASPALSRLIESSTEDEIYFRLPGGARTCFRAMPCNSRSARGLPISCLLLDEAAFFLSETDGPATGERIWQALSPSVAQFGDAARILIASTPYGETGFFHDIYRRAENGTMRTARAHHGTTADFNPTIDPEFLADEERNDPELFGAEYLAQFLESGGGFFDFSLFRFAERGDIPAARGIEWTAALDPAFGADMFAAAVIGRDPEDRRKTLVGTVRAWRPPKGARDTFEGIGNAQAQLMAKVVGVLDAYDVTSAVSDQHLSQAVANYLIREGIACRTFNLTAPMKDAVFGELKARLYSGDLTVPADPDLMDEMRRVRVKYNAGKSSIVLPRSADNGHCDRVMALGLGVYSRRVRANRGLVGDGGGRRKSFEPGLRPTTGGTAEQRLDRQLGLDAGSASRRRRGNERR